MPKPKATVSTKARILLTLMPGPNSPSSLVVSLTLAAATLLNLPLHAQDANQIVRQAVDSEIRASKADHSVWMYRDEDDAPGKRSTYNAIETPQGELRRLIELNGQKLSPPADQKEVARIQHFVSDPSEQAKQRRDGEHDDEQAERFTRMLPEAFTWTVVSQQGDTTKLHYTPNPAFHPPSMESRVLAAMEGEMVVAHDGNRIQSLHGKLTHDVRFGYGLFGKMDAGGTFSVERRAIGPGLWEITENHVHINGHALIFKTISQNSDEVKTGWKPSPDKTLADAARDLGVPPSR
jgi:hypothetical protein